jgi:hypothetical protein
MADKPGIPVGYLPRLRREHPGLYDTNAGGWLAHQPDRREPSATRTERRRSGRFLAA